MSFELEQKNNSINYQNYQEQTIQQPKGYEARVSTEVNLESSTKKSTHESLRLDRVYQRRGVVYMSSNREMQCLSKLSKILPIDREEFPSFQDEKLPKQPLDHWKRTFNQIFGSSYLESTLQKNQFNLKETHASNIQKKLFADKIENCDDEPCEEDIATFYHFLVLTILVPSRSIMDYFASNTSIMHFNASLSDYYSKFHFLASSDYIPQLFSHQFRDQQNNKYYLNDSNISLKRQENFAGKQNFNLISNQIFNEPSKTLYGDTLLLTTHEISLESLTSDHCDFYSIHLLDVLSQTTIFYEVIDISQVIDFVSIQEQIPKESKFIYIAHHDNFSEILSSQIFLQMRNACRYVFLDDLLDSFFFQSNDTFGAEQSAQITIIISIALITQIAINKTKDIILAITDKTLNQYNSICQQNSSFSNFSANNSLLKYILFLITQLPIFKPYLLISLNRKFYPNHVKSSRYIRLPFVNQYLENFQTEEKFFLQILNIFFSSLHQCDESIHIQHQLQPQSLHVQNTSSNHSTAPHNLTYGNNSSLNLSSSILQSNMNIMNSNNSSTPTSSSNIPIVSNSMPSTTSSSLLTINSNNHRITPTPANFNCFLDHIFQQCFSKSKLHIQKKTSPISNNMTLLSSNSFINHHHYTPQVHSNSHNFNSHNQLQIQNNHHQSHYSNKQTHSSLSNPSSISQFPTSNLFQNSDVSQNSNSFLQKNWDIENQQLFDVPVGGAAGSSTNKELKLKSIQDINLKRNLGQKVSVHEISESITSNKSYQHFPEKMKNCQICYVCKKGDGTKETQKSQYVCSLCSELCDKQISLCISNCFEQFHQNPFQYLSQNRTLSSQKSTFMNHESIIKDDSNSSLPLHFPLSENSKQLQSSTFQDFQFNNNNGINDSFDSGMIKKFQINNLNYLKQRDNNNLSTAQTSETFSHKIDKEDSLIEIYHDEDYDRQHKILEGKNLFNNEKENDSNSERKTILQMGHLQPPNSQLFE